MGNAQVAYNRGKSVDTLSLFPVQYVSVFFCFFFFPLESSKPLFVLEQDSKKPHMLPLGSFQGRFL